MSWLSSAPRVSVPLDGGRLRRWRHDDADADALASAVSISIAELRPWMAWAPGYDRRAAGAFLTEALGAWERRTEFCYAIVDARDRLVGSVGLHARIGVGGLEIGYWVHSSHTSLGWATRAAGAAAHEAFRLPGVTHVEIHHDRANERSGRVARRLGFDHVRDSHDLVTAPGEAGVTRVWRLDRVETAS